MQSTSAGDNRYECCETFASQFYMWVTPHRPTSGGELTFRVFVLDTYSYIHAQSSYKLSNAIQWQTVIYRKCLDVAPKFSNFSPILTPFVHSKILRNKFLFCLWSSENINLQSLCEIVLISSPKLSIYSEHCWKISVTTKNNCKATRLLAISNLNFYIQNCAKL